MHERKFLIGRITHPALVERRAPAFFASFKEFAHAFPV